MNWLKKFLSFKHKFLSIQKIKIPVSSILLLGIFVFVFFRYVYPVWGIVFDFDKEDYKDEVSDYWANLQDEADDDQDGIVNFEEIQIYGTDPLNKDSDGDGFQDGFELDNGTDPTGEGDLKIFIIIPKLNVEKPINIVRNTDKDFINNEVHKGLLHYPGTGFPGRVGELDGFVTGHSSNLYFLENGDFRYAFAQLNQLKVDDIYQFRYELQNGRKVLFDYRVISRDILKPTDPEVFSASDQPIITLATCYPPGSAWRRIIVKTILEDVGDM